MGRATVIFYENALLGAEHLAARHGKARWRCWPGVGPAGVARGPKARQPPPFFSQPVFHPENPQYFFRNL